MEEQSRAEIEKLGGAEQLNDFNVRFHLCWSIHHSAIYASLTIGWTISNTKPLASQHSWSTGNLAHVLVF